MLAREGAILVIYWISEVLAEHALEREHLIPDSQVPHRLPFMVSTPAGQLWPPGRPDSRLALSPQPGGIKKLACVLQAHSPIQTHQLATMKREHSDPVPFELTSPRTSVQTEDKRRKIQRRYSVTPQRRSSEEI